MGSLLKCRGKVQINLVKGQKPYSLLFAFRTFGRGRIRLNAGDWCCEEIRFTTALKTFICSVTWVANGGRTVWRVAGDRGRIADGYRTCNRVACHRRRVADKRGGRWTSESILH